MQKDRAQTRKRFTSLSPDHQLSPDKAKSMVKLLESGHVCRNCESQLLRLNGGIYHWCPTCGVDTHGSVTDVCVCGAHVGKHDVLLRCVPVPEWEKQMNPLIRRKVGVGSKPQPVAQPVRFKTSKPELFSEETD